MAAQIDAECASLFFEKLPQEIRDQIYDHAFGSEFKVSSVIHKATWRQRELERRDDARMGFDRNRCMLREAVPYEMRPYPGNPLHCMIVSKRFFNEAASAWFRNATLQFASHEALDKFIQVLNVSPISAITTIHVTWVCRKRAAGVFTPDIRWCTGLRRLQIIVDDGLNILDDKFDFFDRFDDSDFKTFQIVRDLSGMTSLIELEILPGEYDQIGTQKDADCYRANLQALQDYILAQLASSTGYEGNESDLGPFLTGYLKALSISKLKEMAQTYATTGEPEKAAALIHYAKTRGHQTLDEPQDEKHASSQDDISIVEKRDDVIMTDNAANGPCNCKTQSSPSREPRPKRDIGRTRITKRSRQRRSRLSRKQMAAGGILLVNTVCSILALYYATRS